MFSIGVRTKLSPKVRILGIAEVFLHTSNLYLWYRKELEEYEPQRTAPKWGKTSPVLYLLTFMIM